MLVTLSDEDIYKLLWSAFVNGGLKLLAQCDIEFSYSESRYEMARKKLTEPAFEDVLIQMLKDGRQLKFTDHNPKKPKVIILDKGHVWDTITRKKDDFAFTRIVAEMLDADNGNDDSVDAFNFLQYALFGEMRYS